MQAVGGFWRQKLLATLSGFDGCPPLSTAINTQQLQLQLQLQQHRITTTSDDDDDDDDNRLFKGHVYGECCWVIQHNTASSRSFDAVDGDDWRGRPREDMT
ncbi:uncharacterized protein PADG_08117 [Paracoccidioides brasiliensis Pb18]|uniref:Uncharacterized protein n=1 Tax=Paracoccidioides brasiliensis (strain Pb18) TaxID=502780 RepID=C1GLI1_PARBD|nr:uncharacterized protein PADG_08117 [Paracoccidioides brasiliensis Pb18]EEH43298.2 hypothetical protein PADG_08117 [Paracoccidioides brasiliensis Pb18]